MLLAGDKSLLAEIQANAESDLPITQAGLAPPRQRAGSSQAEAKEARGGQAAARLRLV